VTGNNYINLNLKKTMSTNKAVSGFTLLELLMVLLIIGLLAALVGPSLYKKISPARTSIAATQIENFSVALDSFYIDVGDFPTTAQGLEALRIKPAGIDSWNGPYIKKDIPLDPWGREYVYKSPGRSDGYDIISYGRDGKSGGEDSDADITSW
jgi:general secretion pathway protein G